MKDLPHQLRPIGFALIGYTLWVVADSCLKMLATAGLPKHEILTLLNVGSVATVITVAVLRGRKKFMRPRKPKLCLLLGVLQLANMVFFLIALGRLSLVTTYIIVFIGPTMTAILASLFLNERIGWVKALMIVAGFFGVVVALDPLKTLVVHSDWLGYFGAFASMVFYTIYMLLLRFHGESEHPEAAVLYPRLIVGILCFLSILLWPFEPVSLINLCEALLAGASAGIGWMFVTVASQKAPAATIAPYRYSQIISGGIAGYVLWHDTPNANLIIGGLIIILSGFYIATHTQRGVEILEQQDT